MEQSLVSKYREDGVIFLGEIFRPETVVKLGEIIDNLMLGRRSLAGMFFQLDPNSPQYSDVTFDITRFQGPSLNYRKIKNLEYLPEFLSAIQDSAIKSIAKTLIGEDVSSMRYMLVNKPTGSRTPLPWHQDISDEWPMSSKPEFTVWIALDDVDESNGCVEWIEGSHKLGVIEGGHLANDDTVMKLLEGHQIIKGILKAGSAVLFNNGVLHRSAPNLSGRRRRGLTICLMDAMIYNTNSRTFYPKIFGNNALTAIHVSKLEAVPKDTPIDYGE